VIRRVVLFAATNLAVVATVWLVVSVLAAVGLLLEPTKLPLLPLGAACFAWGALGGFVSLARSRTAARRNLGMTLLDGNSGDGDRDWVHATLVDLASRAGVRTPLLGVYQSAEVNALSTGPSRKRSIIGISSAMLTNMSREEIEAVLAHELSHIASGDSVTMALLQGVLNAFVINWAHWGRRVAAKRLDERLADAVGQAVRLVLLLVVGLGAALLVARFSRRRELRADVGGAALVGADKMRAALRQLQRTSDRVDGSLPTLATFKIAGNLGLSRRLSTHAPLAARIAAMDKVTP